MLLVFAFVFHPVGARVKEADIELRFDNCVIATLQPQEIDGRESEVVIHNKLEGHFDMSHPPVAVGVTASQEKQMVKGTLGQSVDRELTPTWPCGPCAKTRTSETVCTLISSQ